MKDPADDPYWNGLAMIGMFLLRWGKLETQLSISFAEIAEDHEIGPEIDPDSISRTLSHLLSKWKRACKRRLPGEAAEIERLTDQISEASIHRNTICHGLQEIKIGGDEGPRDFTITCYQRFHHVVMTTAAMPERLTFDRQFLIDEIVHVREFSRRLEQLTEGALGPLESDQAPEAK